MTDKENGAVIIVSRNSKTDKMSKDVRNGPSLADSHPIKETMNIEPVMMGLVVGGKGLNVKRLRRIYGVNITLPANGGSQITIEGPAKMVSAAKKDIAQNLFTKTSFFIESSYFYLVIGQEGEQNQILQDAFNVRIDLNEEDGRVEITGTRCEEAKKAIESLIERLEIAYPFQEEFLVPSHLIGLVCGKKGSNRRRIESAHNVHVYIPKAVAYYDQQLQRIFVKGADAGKVSAAKQDILDKLETMILDLDESFIGMIIGPGGERVRRIYEEYDVTIYCERKNQGVNGRRKVYIVGEKSRIQAAKDDIVSIITGRKNAG